MDERLQSSFDLPKIHARPFKGDSKLSDFSDLIVLDRSQVDRVVGSGLLHHQVELHAYSKHQ